MYRLFSCATTLGVALLAVGCSGGKGVDARGTVTLDGQPLKAGDISFVSPKAADAPVVAKVQDGAFSAQVAAGSYKVEVRVPKEVPESARKPLDPPTKETLPNRYNSQSELKAEVPAGGAKDLKFDLKSK